MFEIILPAILGLCGGSLGVAAFNYWANRGRNNAEVRGIKDDQTAEWRDSALALSKEILAMRREMHEISTRMEDAEHALGQCLQKVADCNCHD